MRLMSLLLRLRTRRFIGPLALEIMFLYGVDIPKMVQIGAGFKLWHRGQGVVMAPNTRLGNRVHMFQQVTIGGADPTLRHATDTWQGVVVQDDVVVCAGAKILAGPELLTVGRGTIVGANAVLLESTGEYEIWAGAPARRVGFRDRDARNSW